MSISVNFNALPHQETIHVPVGDSYRKLWTLQRDTGVAVTAVNLAGVTWSLIISDGRGGTALIDVGIIADWTASGIHIDDAAAGQFTVHVLHADCAALGTLQRAHYDVVAVFPGDHAAFPNLEKTLLQGQVTIAADATTA